MDITYAQEYAAAKNLCYHWYLLHCVTVNHDGCTIKEKYFSDGFHGGNINAIVLTVSLWPLDSLCVNDILYDSLKH